MDLTSQRIAILGAGRSGQAAAALARHLGGIVTVFDDAPAERLSAHLERLRQADLTAVIGSDATALEVRPGQWDLVIISPGIDESWPLPQKFTSVGVPLMGETEFAWRHCLDPLIAITGTNGKSTCTELIAGIFNGSGRRCIPSGNHGMPLSEVVLSGQRYDALALEISSFQLETIQTFHPQVALWLNFAADHLDRYPDMAAYFEAKARIFENLIASDLAIVRAGETVSSGAAQRVTFSAYDASADWFFDGSHFLHHGSIAASASPLRLKGRHNMENVLAALIACQPFGISAEQSIAALAAYGVPRHRCEWVRTLQDRLFINDSKATNLHAVEACVRALDEPLILIVGGKEKKLDFAPLRDLLPQRARALVAIGETATRWQQEFGPRMTVHTAPDMDAAVAQAFTLSQPGDAIVLSPGTSSFDMYTGYAQRGDVFCHAVMNLA